MIGYRFDDFGAVDNLNPHEQAMPLAQRGELLIKVCAVALNYRDIAIILGRYPHSTRKGLIPTSDAAGIVVEVGEGVTQFQRGDRVISTYHPRWFGGEMPSTVSRDSYGSESDGWLVEYKAVSQESVVAAPKGFSFEEASTLPCAGLTAWSALSSGEPVRAGQTVLTLGSGGVSIFALQLAKSVGATVISTTSSVEKEKRLRSLGADHVINYVKEPAWEETVRQLTNGRGVDRVVEVGGPETFLKSLRAVTIGGEIANIGFLSKQNLPIDFYELKKSRAVIRPISVGDRGALLALVRAVEMRQLKPVIDRVYTYENAKGAFLQLLEGSHLGKIVIRLAE